MLLIPRNRHLIQSPLNLENHMDPSLRKLLSRLAQKFL
jgi:hypothetical protein